MYLLEIGEWIHILFSKKQAAQDISREAQKFEGLYEPIYHLSKDSRLSSGALDEWQVRAEYLVPNSALARTVKFLAQSNWAKKRPQCAAKHLVRCFHVADITRDEPQNGWLLVSPLQASAYRALDGHLICVGENIHVITAAWYCNGLVVEHGLSGEFK